MDAFCTWYDCKPFVFLNTMKSAERSRFDAAHELGHLVRDVYSMQHGEVHGLEMERQADAFASAFLMPKESVITNRPPVFTIKYLMKLKHYWGVSLAALAYRLSRVSPSNGSGIIGICALRWQKIIIVQMNQSRWIVKAPNY